MTQQNTPFTSWRVFAATLETQFGPSPYDCPRPLLFKLTQTRAVDEYHDEFIALANRSDGVSSDALLDCFIGGLQPPLKWRVLA